MTGELLSASDLAAIRERAEKCDSCGSPTRCSRCATILLLIAHIRLIEKMHAPQAMLNGSPMNLESHGT